MKRSLADTYINVRIRQSPVAAEFADLKLLADTAAAYSWLPRAMLEKLGVKPTRKARFRTVNGEVLAREVGHVFIEHDGESAPTTAVFGEEDDESVFGLHGLESLGLELDPTTMQVRKSEALLAR